jgi:hypothetical protein
VFVRRGSAALLAVAACLGVSAARGDSASDKQKCASSYENGQRLERERNLVEARNEFLACSRSCQTALQGECLGWLHEVELATPSVVIGARTNDGRDLADVRVLVDGRPFTDRLDGKALDLDPGEHVFRFIPARGTTIERRFIIREAEKARELTVILDDSGAQMTPTTPSPTAEPGSRRPIPVLAWVFAGVAVVGLGSFAGFGLTGRSEQNSTLAHCNPMCSPSQIDDVLHKYIAADVSLGVSIAALGVAAVLVLTRPTLLSANRDRTSVGFAF